MSQAHVDAVDELQSVPESVGRYRIGDLIGVGGMGKVYRARDERLDRWVAIKHVQPTDVDIRARERFRREARAVASLSHPAIVQVHDIVETAAGDWIVMELVEGRTLQQMIDQDELEVEQIVDLGREIAEGLAEAHAKGIVHRDLKTENIKVTAQVHAKILDFGLAKRIWQETRDSSLSEPGALLGTSRAMAPEQVLGEEVDHRSDLFSFGTLLFETLTGRRPFAGTSLILTLAQVCTEEPADARTLNPRVPPELSELIGRLLEKNPLDRPQSADEVAEELQRIAGRMASAAFDHRDPSDTAEVPVALAASIASALAPARPSGPLAPPVVARAVAHGDSASSSGHQFSGSTAGIFVKTLVHTALVDSHEIGDRSSDARAYEIFSRHDRLVRDLLLQHEGLEIDKADDGFLLLFERPVDAAEFALSYHRRLAELSLEVGIGLRARAGIHLSEVFLRGNTIEEIKRGAKPFKVEGLAKLLVSRLRDLASGGQTLLTKEAHDMTRRALVGHRLGERTLHWTAHGRYRFTGVDQTVRVFEVSYEPIEAAGPPAAADAQKLEEGAPAPGRGGRRRRRALTAAAALAAIAAGSLLLRSSGPMASSAGFEKAPRESRMRTALAVLGFRNISGQPEHVWLSMALAELLATDLAAGEDLRLIDGESVARLKRSRPLFAGESLAPDTLEMIENSLGADYVILGSYLYMEESNQLTVQMKLQDTRLRETVASISETAAKSDLLALVSRTGDVVRAELGLAAISRETAAAVRATLSQDAEANRLYFEALKQQRGFDALAARDLLIEALELDPDFAMAHAALSEAWLDLGYDREAEQSASRAFQIASGTGMPREDHLRIEGSYHEAAGNWQAAIETHRVLWGFFPDDVNYGLRLAKAQVAAGQALSALGTVASLRRLPAPMLEDPRIDLIEAAAAAELLRDEAVVEAAQRSSDKGLAGGNSALVAEAERLKAVALNHLGRRDQALASFEDAQRLFLEIGDEAGYARVLFNLSLLMDGERNLSRAEEYLREALAIFQKTGSRKGLARAQNGLAFMIQAKGKLTAARRLAEQAFQTARELGYPEREINYLDTLVWILFQMAELGRAEETGRELVALCQEHGQIWGEAWAYHTLAHVALSAGDLPKAQALFEKILRMTAENEERIALHLAALAHNGLGSVYLTIGDLAQARASFERYWELQAEHGWGEQAVTEPRYALTLVEMGEYTEAESIAREIADRFQLAERFDYRAAALEVQARALRELGRSAEARAKLDEALALGADSEVAEVRLRLAITAARQLAPTDYREASRNLRSAAGEAKTLGLRGVELEANLAFVRIETRFATTEGRAQGGARLQALAEEARRLGFGLIARQAAEELVSLQRGDSADFPEKAPSRTVDG